ncbi:retrovirus-related pol polyprotein from transposon TNT 1-94, partial [Tanacetum coccineum]
KNLKAQLKDHSNCVTIHDSKPKVLDPGRYLIDVEPISPRLKKNREVHLHYIKHLKENIETLREIVEEAKVKRPLDTSLASACRYTKHSQELLEKTIGYHKSKPRSNTKKNRTLPSKSALKQVEAHSRMNKSNEKQENHVDSSISIKRTIINSNSNSLCKTCNECLISSNHVKCVERFLKSYNKTPVKQIWRVKQVKQTWKPTGKIFTTIGYHWKPTGRIFPLGDQCPLTRITKPKALPVKQWKPTGRTDRPLVFGLRLLKIYDWRSLTAQEFREKVYRDCQIWKRSFWCNYGLWELFAFKKHTCFVRNLDGVDLIKGSRGMNLYTISVDDWMRSSPICLLSKASNRRLNHLNFGTLNDLARKDLVRGLPRLKFKKDHLCSACQLGKSRKATHKPKTINTIIEVLHMDLCGPMRVQSINGNKYILVIVDDYSRFTWVKFLRSKDDTLAFVINLLKQLQVGLNKTVRFIRIDNGTEFVHKVLID